MKAETFILHNSPLILSYMLYLVATPIGNLEDMTFRAVRILREVSLIAAEDTRHTKKLLTHFDIHTPLISYHEYSDNQRLAELVAKAQVEDVALVSDAGTPGLSDPGYQLVQAAWAAGVKVSPIPGPTAAVSALVSSGLPTDSFLFLGFLPSKTKARQEALQNIAAHPYTLILYESPHRLLDTLADIKTTLGERQIVIGRELTKLYEEIWRGTVSEAAAHFGEGVIKGELTLVIAGADKTEAIWTEAAVIQALQEQFAAGKSNRDAVAAVVALSGWRKKQVYVLALQLGGA